ncbi:hypothetical protein IFM89_027746 [Coptis chinensis]|uniref:Uncharacterized protein n=1 Tax=Coptis chinensis TaxID=261450 RepID=A0A835HYX8_9MAGN|nr:hypothetical protein IFM89_027746 [Coptis chinensis]
MVDYADSESSPEREVEVGGALKILLMRLHVEKNTVKRHLQPIGVIDVSANKATDGEFQTCSRGMKPGYTNTFGPARPSFRLKQWVGGSFTLVA